MDKKMEHEMDNEMAAVDIEGLYRYFKAFQI